MKLLKKINKKESGQALILVLVLMLVGALIITPLLGFMSTGLMVGQVFEEKMDRLYAADAGVEDAIYNIITPTAPHYDELQGLDEGDPFPSYTLTDINGLQVTVNITKLSILSALLTENELDKIKFDQPHADWIDFTIPADEIVRDYGEGWVEYTCHITINHDGAGQCTLESLGAFFSPLAGDQSLVEGPYGYEGTEFGEMDFAGLLDGSPEVKFSSGGFAFIWRWELSPPAIKFNADLGFSFKFKVYDPDWAYSLYFVWSAVTRNDISFATNAPSLYKWLIEAEAGDTTVQSAILEKIGVVNILTWEINPPG